MYMCVLLIYVEFYMYISCSQNLFDFLNKNSISIKNVEWRPENVYQNNIKFQISVK